MCTSNHSDASELIGQQEPPEYQLTGDQKKISQLEDELSRVKAELEQYRALCENLPALEIGCQQAKAEIEAALHQSQQQLETITANIPGVVYRAIHHADGRISLPYISEGSRILYGFDAYEVMAFSMQQMLDLLHPDDLPKIAAEIKTRQQMLMPGSFEYRIITKSGEVKWIRDTASFRWTDEGDFIIDGVTIDITDRVRGEEERKRVEAALQHSNAYYQSLANALPQCLYRKDLNGRLTFANRSLLTMLGKSLEEALGLTVYDCYPKNLADQYAADDARVIQTGEALDAVEQHQVPTTNETIYVQVVKTPVRDEVGNIIGTQGIFWDITERTRLEQALQASEAKLSDILNNAIAAITSLRVFENREWQHEYWSAGCEVIFGYTPDELLADRMLWISRVLPEDGEVMRSAKTFEAIFEQTSMIHEYRFRHKDGGLRWISATLSSRRDEAANCWIVTMVNTDVSDRKYIEEQRKQAEVALRESEERFRQLEENIQTVFWMVALTEKQPVLYVSPAYETIWQRSRERVYQRAEEWTDAIHVEDRDRVLTALRTIANGNYDIEYRIVRPDGSIRWIYDRAFPVQAKDGKVYRVAGMSEDITERKCIEDALRQQAERERLLGDIAQRIRQSLNLEEILNTTVTEVRQVLQADRTVIFRFQTDGNGVVAVEAVIPPWSSSLGSIIPTSRLTEAQLEYYRQGHVRAIADIATAGLGKSHFDLLMQFQIKAQLVVPILQGDHLWGLLVAHQCNAPRQWQSYEVDLLQQLATQLEIAIYQSQLFQRVTSLNNDLEKQVQEQTTELRKAFDFEALLRRITDKVRDSLEESQILQTAVQELGIELQVYSCDTGVYDLNQAYSAIRYEYLRSGVGIPSGAGTIVPFSTYPQIYSQLLQGKYLQFCWLPTFTDPARTTDCPFAMLACPVMDDQKVIGDLWLYRAKEDCFEEAEIRLIQQVANHCAIALRQSRLYQSAQAQVKELERLNHLKDDFLSTISHELRTPVSNIWMAAQMLEINLDRLGILDSQPNSIARYLQVLKEDCQREIGLINDLLDLTQIEAATEPLMRDTIDLSTWIPYIAEPFLERFQVQDQQLIIDMPTNPVLIATDTTYLERILSELLQNACKYTPVHETIQITAQAQAEYIEISVTNTGVEIPEDELGRIFDKFYRIPNKDPWKHGGTGLGLALVKRLVARLDGTISVTSSMGRTTFMLRFPRSHTQLS